jgi:ribosome maturation factor RimP
MYSESLLPKLEELARRAAEPAGVEVAWVEFKSEGPKWFLRVFIDRESGVGLKDCEQVSERLGVILDVEDPIESSYTLEVSSPGLNRPLWKKRDYERFTGRLARIQTAQQFEGRQRFRGRLAGVDMEDVLLDDDERQWRIPLSIIENGRLEVELFPKKGQSSGKARKHS